MQIPSPATMTAEEILLASYSAGRPLAVPALRPAGDPAPDAAPTRSCFPFGAVCALMGAVGTGFFAWLGEGFEREAHDDAMAAQAARLRELHAHYVGGRPKSARELDELWSMPIEAPYGDAGMRPRRLFRDGSEVFYDPETGRPLRAAPV